jgi:ATP-dependent RNA helicase DeaD
VINFELPDDVEVYTHRSGRTGRAGNTGVCMSIIHTREMGKMRHIQGIVQSQFHKLELPSGKDVCRKQFFAFMEKLLKADISHGDYESYVPMLEEKFADVTKEEVLKRVAAMEFDRFLKYYENAEDLNAYDRRPERGERTMVSRRGADGGDRQPVGEKNFNRDTRGRQFGAGAATGDYARLFVNLGTKDGFYKASFLQFILDMSDLKKEVLGRIDMKEMNSWIEIDKRAAKQMITAIDGKNYKGRRIRMNDADSRR